VRQRSRAIRNGRADAVEQRQVPVGISAGERAVRGVDGRAGYPSGRVGTAEPRARAQGDEAPAVLSRRAAPEARVTMPPPSRRPCPDDRATTILRGGAPSGAAGTEDVVSPGTWREGMTPTRREFLRTAGVMGAGL